MYMWRAVDKEGVVLDALVQKRRNKAAALKLLRKLLKRQGFVPDKFVTDGLATYRAAMKELGCQSRHAPGRLRENNRAENSPPRPKARAKDAKIQIAGTGPAIHLHPQRRLQHIQHRTPSHFTKHNARPPSSRHGEMENRVRPCRMKFDAEAFARATKVYLTVLSEKRRDCTNSLQLSKKIL